MEQGADRIYVADSGNNRIQVFSAAPSLTLLVVDHLTLLLTWPAWASGYTPQQNTHPGKAPGKTGPAASPGRAVKTGCRSNRRPTRCWSDWSIPNRPSAAHWGGPFETVGELKQLEAAMIPSHQQGLRVTNPLHHHRIRCGKLALKHGGSLREGKPHRRPRILDRKGQAVKGTAIAPARIFDKGQSKSFDSNSNGGPVPSARPPGTGWRFAIAPPPKKMAPICGANRGRPSLVNKERGP